MSKFMWTSGHCLRTFPAENLCLPSVVCSAFYYSPPPSLLSHSMGFKRLNKIRNNYKKKMLCRWRGKFSWHLVQIKTQIEELKQTECNKKWTWKYLRHFPRFIMTAWLSEYLCLRAMKCVSDVQFISVIINCCGSAPYLILHQSQFKHGVLRRHAVRNEHTSLYTVAKPRNLFSLPRSAIHAGPQCPQTTSHARIRLYPVHLDSHRNIEFAAPVKSLVQSYFGFRCQNASDDQAVTLLSLFAGKDENVTA
jgi:hypothetical protein